MGHLLVTPAAVELLDLDDVATHLRLDIEDMDPTETALIDSWIRAARNHVEQRLSMALVEQTWRLTMDFFPPLSYAIVCPRPPLRSVTSIVYLDSTGVEQTLDPATYVLDIESRPGRIGLVAAAMWPVTAPQIASVRVTYIAGLDPADDGLTDLLADIRAAMLLLVGDLYRNREAQVSDTLNANRTVDALLDPYVRQWDGASSLSSSVRM